MAKTATPATTTPEPGPRPVMPVPVIPDKLYFRIGEVAELVGVKPHVLRYWETEFKTLRPAKSRTEQRLYQRRDIELLFRLKELLYVRGLTIAGARKLLRGSDWFPQEEPVAAELLSPALTAELQELRAALQRLRARLDQTPDSIPVLPF